MANLVLFHACTVCARMCFVMDLRVGILGFLGVFSSVNFDSLNLISTFLDSLENSRNNWFFWVHSVVWFLGNGVFCLELFSRYFLLLFYSFPYKIVHFLLDYSLCPDNNVNVVSSNASSKSNCYFLFRVWRWWFGNEKLFDLYFMRPSLRRLPIGEI
jgi:hypothetical protein